MPKKHAQSLYYDILEQEVRLARSVAHAVLRPKPINVWEVLIPIVFILGFMRTRNRREMFVQNIIFTKKMALGAGRDKYLQGLSDQDIHQHLEKKTQELIETVDKEVYSEGIRQAQLKEMALLVSHYHRLFQTEKSTHAESIAAAYTRPAAYLNFLEQLRSVEIDVGHAAIRTLGAKADKIMMERIETCTASLRQKQAQQYFADEQHE